MNTRSYAETYTMRSRFFRLMGEAGKVLADAYCEGDLENQAVIKDAAFEAMTHSLVEHHGYTRQEVRQPSDAPSAPSDAPAPGDPVKEMLAVLKRVTEYAENYADLNDEPLNGDCQSAVNEANAIIDRAEGRA